MTLDDANEIFGAIGVEIKQHSTLGYYYAAIGNFDVQEKTLTALCQVLVKKLADG